MILNSLYARESALFSITATVDGTTVKAKHGGAVRIAPETDVHRAIIGDGIATVVRDGFRYAFFVALQRATSADKGTSEAVKCAGLLKRAASFVRDEWETVDATREKILFPILVSAILETVSKGADRGKVEKKVGAWSEEERAAIVNDNEAIRAAYVRLIGKPKSNVDVANLLASLDEDEE